MKLELETTKLGAPRNPRKPLIPLSPARKNITFAREEQEPALTPLPIKAELNQAVLQLCGYYLELGQTPMQAYRSALADFPEAMIKGGIVRTRLGL